jgi:GNAT superfamily N-acetyltransferase
MDDAALFARMHASLRAFYGVVAAGASDSHLVEREGLTAAVVPATPDRSVCNGVVYDRPRALASAIEELEHAYRRAGVRAWTVWVPPHDRESAALLEERGHRLDAAPTAMAFELAGFDGALNGGCEIDPVPDVADIGRLNVAYGYDGDFERALADLEPGTAQLYVARDGSRACACAGALDNDGDCCIMFVATAPEMRGKGLASELMTRALIDARERGCATTSLQATKMGKPLYLRLGYRDLGPIEMWERREP